MEPSLSALDGEGHPVVVISSGDMAEADELSAEVIALAQEWSELESPDLANVEAKWESGAEAKTMADGLELTGVVLARLGLQAQAWENSINTESPWKYTNVPLGSLDATLRVGVSNGGVVSVDGDPFTPGDREMNVRLPAVEMSIRAHAERHNASAASWSVSGSPRVGGLGKDQMRTHVPSDVLESLQVRLLAEITEPEQKTRSEQRNSMSSKEIIGEGHRIASTNPYDPKDRDTLYARFTLENGASLEDAELERIYGSVVLPEFCIKFMRAERADGVTAEGIYAALNVQHHMGRGQEEREFLDRLIRDADLVPGVAQTLTDRLQELSAAHLKLIALDLNEGLDEDQDAARDEIENRLRALVSDVEGIEEAMFSHDGRGPTVRLVFESGASNSFAEGWIVPLKDGAVEKLPDDFWQQYVPETQESLLVLKLVSAGNDPSVVTGQVTRLFDLATQHTKLAVELSEVDADLVYDEGFQAVKADLRDQMRALAKELKGVEDVEFGMDPRYATVGLDLESGRRNRGSAGWNWGVSVSDEALEKLNVGFWRELVPGADVEHDGGYLVLSITNTSNAVFVDLGRDQEIARIMHEASARIAGLANVSEAEFALRDVNGNRVGEAYMSETASAELPHGHAVLSVRVSTEEEDEPFETVRAAADIVRQASEKIKAGHRSFMLHDTNGIPVSRFEYREEPSLPKDGLIDMYKAISDGRVYLAEGGYSGIAEDDFRYVVTSGDFQPGYGQGPGEVWLVNAKGKVASGYTEAPKVVEEKLLRALKRDERSNLLEVAEGRTSFDEFEGKVAMAREWDEGPQLG